MNGLCNRYISPLKSHYDAFSGLVPRETFDLARCEMRRLIVATTLIFGALLTGCATVPMASLEDDKARKEFSNPSQDVAGLYIYRNSTFGGALKKTVYIDGEIIGESAPMTYFYRQIQPGRHVLSTESEFSDNFFALDAKGGENYYVHQYMKLGVFVGGANLKLVSQEEGKKGVLECKLANSLNNDSLTFAPKSNEIVETALINSATNVSGSASGEGVSVFDYYGEAEEELNTKSYDKNLWARALVEAEGDEQKRKARYIELRANQLYSENVSSISKSNLNEQPVPASAVSGTDISGTYVSYIRGGPSDYFGGDRKLKVTFKQSGNDIIGTNDSQRVILKGTRKGDTIKFEYYGRWGNLTGVWKINPDGTKLEGTWRGSRHDGVWNLAKI